MPIPIAPAVSAPFHNLREILDPASIVDTGIIHTRDDGGDTELFYDDDKDRTTQLTKDGVLNAGALGLIDHGSGLSGLGDDDHTQYALLIGRAGGSVLTGGINANDDLTLVATSNATQGDVFIDTGPAATDRIIEIRGATGGVGIGKTFFDPVVAGDILTLDQTFNGTARVVLMNRDTGVAGLVQFQCRSLFSGGNSVAALMEQISLTNTINSGIRQTGKMVLATSGGNHAGLNIGTENASNLAIYTNALARMTVFSGGQVHIGTTVLDSISLLLVEISSNGERRIFMRNLNSGTSAKATIITRGQSVSLGMKSTSAAFTPTFGEEANSNHLISGVGKLIIATTANQVIKFKTGSGFTFRMQILFNANTLQGNAGLKVEGGAGVHTLTLSGGASAASSIALGIASELIGLYGVAPVVRGAALTAEDANAIDATYDAVEQAVLNNVRTRLGELEARMQGIGAIN